MSTVQDFENAPVGATASSAETNTRYVKSPDRWLLFDGRGDWWVDEYGLESEGFTLDPAAPTTAQEALDRAWNLAHPVKEGQFIPEGTTCLARFDDGYRSYETQGELITRETWTDTRTLDPLPDPKPGWVNAPAVVAFVKGWVSCADPQVFSRGNETGTQWVRDTKVYHWYELVGVVPLYPKGTDNDR